MSDLAESPRDLSRTPQNWQLGVRHWLDPEDADRATTVRRMNSLTPVIEQADIARDNLLREQHRAREGVVLRLRERDAQAAHCLREELSEVYAAGLELRNGRRINVVPIGDAGWDLFMFQWFHALGVDEPAGIAWCRTCLVVFPPARKSHASKCDGCHKHPPPAPPVPTPTAEGGWIYALPSENSWNLVRLTPCEKCGVPFFAKRSDARSCPDRKECRERAAIRRENIERGFFQPS